jgi:predicted regulator of Ras-like GTPase activity (Roadblock/LC7/MglB family)
MRLRPESDGGPSSNRQGRTEFETYAMSASSSHTGKRGLFGYFKGLFRRDPESGNSGEAESYQAETMPLVAPPVEIASPAYASDNDEGMAAASESFAAPDLDRQDAAMVNVLALPLQPIIDGFNPELKKQLRKQNVGNITINVAMDKVLAQLAQGQVRVPFGDVRKAAPMAFHDVAEFDRVSVALPLHEILARLNPALLVRRTAARQVEVPADITSPFAGRGEGLNILVGNAKPVQPAAPQPTAPARPQAIGRGSSSSGGTTSFRHQEQVKDIPAPISFSPPQSPSASTAAPKPRVVATPVPTRVPMPGTANATPALHLAAQAPLPNKPVAAPAPVSTPPAAGAAAPAVIQVPLRSLSETWPDSIRAEIAQNGLTQTQVALPAELVETALKKGRVAFSWKTVRSWITPAAPATVSVHDATELEFPLMVVAPLFLARKKTDANSRVAVDASIPNLFFGFPQPEIPAPVAAPASVPKMAAPSLPVPPAAATPTTPSTTFFTKKPLAAPAAKPVAVPGAGLALPQDASATALTAAAASSAAAAAAAAAAAEIASKPRPTPPAETNYYLWADDVSDTQQFHLQALKQKGTSSTEFMKRYSSPNEIVTRAAALDGVAGALIALPDGLMVASRIPAELNGETLAAFLPQIFAKVSSATKELRMGELNNVSFTVGNVPWKIFRVNAIFFAAFGHPAQPLSTADLAALAGELDRKNK